ncbi:MAG: DUF362 domain-containing protein [Thermoplasmatota archaeon]
MKVFMDRCNDYSESERVIRDAFEKLGGIDSFVKDGEKILVNPNLLQGAIPERAVTTHPDFIIAVVKILEEKDVDIIVGDSPGGPMSERRLEKAYKKSGWDRVEKETSAELMYNTGEETTSHPGGTIKKSFSTIEIFSEIDGVINLPKLKTHNLTVFTGAVKNTFGIVHGMTKSAYHGTFKGLTDFSDMLLDVYSMVSPRISIMDGIWSMEGSGPASGEGVQTDMILASRNGIALDHAACKAVGIPIQKVETIVQSDMDPNEIEYVKLIPNDFNYSFNYPKGGTTTWWAPDILTGLLANFYLDRPTLDKEKCIKCAKCMDICPKNAITMEKYGPKISWWKCIRCYCCAEICPVEALNVG